ncbi:MAG: WecB/TagA/CpsF family glycosyltransferase [Pseudomonadota bacterium]
MGGMPKPAMAPEPRLNLLGVRVSAVNLQSAADRILRAVEGRMKGYVCIRDVHGVVKCQHDEKLRQAHREAFLVTPDGMPVVWSLRLAGHADVSRVYGPDLMLALFDQGQAKGVRHYLYGSTPETLSKLEDRLAKRFPEAEIVGSYSPPFRDLTEAEKGDVARQIDESGADIVWVGLGTPRQELWMAEMRDLIDAPIFIGVGAAFDFHAGVKAQAPRVIQRSGFEWLFRVACEPRRLLPRYAVAVPTFLFLGFGQLLGRPQPSIDPADG